MSLPTLPNWEATRESLHRAALVVSAFAKLGRERDPIFYHHLTLYVTPDGLTSGATANGEFSLNLHHAAVIHAAPNGEKTQIPLAGLNQVTLGEALHKAVPNQQPELSELDNQEAFDTTHAADYAHTLSAINAALNAVRAGLAGDRTPIVVFPHHFDLSFLWFNGAGKNEHQPHINWGFSPGDSSITRPYLYAYAWAGEAYANLQVPPPWQHHPNFTTGVMVDYDTTLRDAPDLNALVAAAAAELIRAASAIW